MTNLTVSNIDRERICNSYMSGSTVIQISTIMNINRTTVHSIIRRFLLTGSSESLPRGGVRPRKITNEISNAIKRWVDEDCGLSLSALVRKVMNDYNIVVSISTIVRCITAFNYTLKRIHYIPERRNDPANIELRRIYALEFIGLGRRFSESELYFIDEAGFNVSMRVSRGRSLIGTDAVLTVPSLRARNISICCAINVGSIIHYETKTSAYNSGSYIIFLRNLLNNLALNGKLRGVLIMDNVNLHKTIEVRNFIANSGFELFYLPPYSPFLNPIENAFSEMKNFVKRGQPSNESELMALIEDGNNIITSNDCGGFYRKMISYLPRCINSEVIND